jgi:hypothetical protein
MLYNSSQDYLYNLDVYTSSEAKKIWKKSIKEEWGLKCAYCGSDQNLTIDHILPQSKGGKDIKTNVVCACKKCNNSKGHTPWKEWYEVQDFFTSERMSAIVKWMTQDNLDDYVVYRPRKNNTSL